MGVVAVADPIRTFCPARHASPKKSPGPEHGDDGFPADLIDHGELHTPGADIHNVLGGIALREDDGVYRIPTTFRATPVESRKAWASKMGAWICRIDILP